MAKFTLNVQLQLQSPKNVAQVVNQLQRQLGAVNVKVGVQGATQATKQMAQLTSATNRAASSARSMGDAFGVSLKRFTAFSIASRAIGLFTSKLSAAIGEAISFQNEIVRLSQVTGESVQSFGKLTAQITNLSTTLGVSSKQLLGVATILAQAGLNARDTEIAVNALAKTALAPTFGDIKDTAEGAVAVIAQFGEGVGALERQLGAINEVSAKFAVESEDLISVIRRTGGVFKASGGSLEELLALFTSVRATTREGAETIATGLRTIFTRLQRPQTIEYLKQFGVQLTDLNGKFVGPYESIRQLSQALSGLEEGDVRFIQIAEELGGYRQIGKVIPLLRQFEIAEKARQAAIEGGTSLDKDAIVAQQSLAVQFTKVREQFLALIRGISETSSFKVLVKTSLNLASALIKIADALKPLIPILLTFATIRFTQNIGGFLQGVGGGFGKIVGPNPGLRRQFGGPIRKFATGGLVPGSGNGDTVPAMLSPGEFVIRKSSVNKLGVDTLLAMNNNRYAKGGVQKGGSVQIRKGQIGAFFLNPPKGDDPDGAVNANINIVNPNIARKLNLGLTEEQINLQVLANATKKDQARLLGDPNIAKGAKLDLKTLSAKGKKPNSLFNDPAAQARIANFSASRSKNKKQNARIDPIQVPLTGTVEGFFTSNRDLKQSSTISSIISESTKNSVKDAIKTSSTKASKILQGIDPLDPNEAKVAELAQRNLFSAGKGGSALDTIEGYIFEGLISSLTGAKIAGGSSAFDFPSMSSSVKKKLSQLFGSSEVKKLLKADAKRTYSAGILKTTGKGTIPSKIEQDLAKGNSKGLDLIRRAFGGNISGSDTVPALLTPGEFVFNKKAAQNIGYSNLNTMNKKGVAGFARGGAVGVQRFAEGGDAKTARLIGIGAIATLPALLSQLTGPVTETSSAFVKLVDSFGGIVTTLAGVTIALEAFGVSLTLKNIKSVFSSGPGSFSDTIKKSFKNIATSASIPESQVKKATRSQKFLAISKEKEESLMKKIQSAKAEKEKLRKVIDVGMEEGDPTKVANAIDAIKQKKIELRTDAGKLAKRQNITKGLTNRVTNLGKGLDFSSKSAKFGQFLGKGGKVGQLAARGIGAIGPLIGGIARLAPPIAAVITAVSIFSKVVSDTLGYQTKYNKAIEEGNVAKAQELAVLKEVPGIVQLFGSSAAEGYQSIAAAFGGDSVESLKALAVAQAAAGKYTKEFEQNAKKAATVMLDLESGAISASQALANADLTANLKNSADALNAAKASAQANLGNKSTGLLAGTRNVFSAITLGFVDSADQRNTKIDQENKQLVDAAKKTFTENVDQLRPAFRGLAAEFAISGKTTAEAGAAFDKTLKDMGLTSLLTTAELDNLKKEFNNQAKAVEENIKFLKALNFGLRDVNANAQATTLSLSNLEGSLETGYNGFSQALSVLEASIESTGASLDATDVSKATKTLEATLKGFGASDAEVKSATGGLKALQVAQAGAKTALQNVSKNMDPKNISPGKIKENLGLELGKILDSQGIDPASKKRLIESFSNLEIDQSIQEQIAAGNYDQVVEKIFGPLGDQVKKDVLGPMQERIKQEGILVNFTKERIALERNAIEARKQAIDIEIEARKSLEEFGGPVLKTKDKINALNRQLNLDLGAAGAGNIGAGTAFELNAAQSRITSAIARREALQATAIATTGQGAFQGVRGVEQDKAAQLEQAQQAIVDYSRKRIELIKEELQVAEKKNALEKSAFQKLVGGDIIGAIQDQQAAAAAKILKSGDKQFARLFGPTALGAGLQSLEEQGASAQELKNAALAAGGSLRQAQVFSGTTPEMEALKQQGRQFAGILETAGKAQADIKDMQVQTQNVVINTARIDMGAAANVQPFSRGGVVYASRGMFVPRGTDTVPAMLTPGEFVINRRAVQAGNNLQILKAINNGGKINNSSGGTAAAMSGGGQVGYYMFGGVVEALGKTLGNLGGTLTPIFDKFAESIKQLQNVQLSVKLDTTNVNINFNGAGFLATLTEDVKNGVLEKVKQEITRKMTIGTDGKASFSGSTL